MSVPDRRLRRLARLYGVQTSYHDIDGGLRRATPGALIDVLCALGAPLSGPEGVEDALRAREREIRSRALPPVVVAWDGRMPALTLRRTGRGTGRLALRLRLEDGAERVWTASAGCVRPPWDDLPFGYHELTGASAGAGAGAGEPRPTLVISAPLQAAGPESLSADVIAYAGSNLPPPPQPQPPPGPEPGGSAARLWSAFLPLYALETRRSWGVGDMTDLAELARWVAARGGSLLGTLPLLAAFLDEPFEPSPYSPVSRLYWNELYADVSDTRELNDCPEAKAVLASAPLEDRIRAARAADVVDYRERYRDKRRVLELLAACFFRDGGDATGEFADFLTLYPDARRYARFRAVCDRLREPWPRWPASPRDGRIAEGDYDERAYRTHLYAQLLMHRQLAGLSAASPKSGARLYLDLPLGVHGHGYDVWAYRDLFAADVSAGAPPDPFISAGQDWGFPPIRPLELRERRHDYFIRSIRTHLRYAGALRLDHVMSLHRLFWVPHGRAPLEGVYVRYPADELYAILTLESRRHAALLIGEDLGTVPPAVRRRMDRHGLRRMWVGQFEFGTDPDHAIPTPPERAIATLNTHDMPTFLGWWCGDDIDARQELGWLDGGAAARDRAWRGAQRHALIERLRREGLLADDAPAHVLLALLRRLAAGPAETVLVNLEDLWGETRPHNVPGTWRERPNWRRRARLSLSEFGEAADVRAAIAALRR